MSLSSSSSFRRWGQRNDRRRRLLTDDLSRPSDGAAYHFGSEGAPPRKSQNYGNAEFLERQMRLLDLVPRRMVSLVFLLAAATAILAGLVAAYAWMIQRVAYGAVAVTALDLAAKGSLGCWYSSLLLLAAAAAAVLVYSVRRHRIDDYQGRYRIWLWAAACCFLMAADQATSLREGFRDLMIALTGTTWVGDGALWSAIVSVIVVGAVGSRVLMDMRSSRLSMGVLLAAVIAHALAVAGRLGWIPSEGGSWEVPFLAGAEMVGSLLLLASMTLFARHVRLDAEGLLPRREPKADHEVTEEEEAADATSPATAHDRWMKVDAPHSAPQPAYQRAAAPASSACISAAATAPSSINRKLTKAERKALKERLMRERLERQRGNRG
jgi:hypothetical protein